MILSRSVEDLPPEGLHGVPKHAEGVLAGYLLDLAGLAMRSGQRHRAERMRAAARILHSPPPPKGKRPPRLTKREVEVAAFITSGLTNRQIAHQLEISERTVHTHVQNILKKLTLASRTQIAVWAALQQHDEPGTEAGAAADRAAHGKETRRAWRGRARVPGG